MVNLAWLAQVIFFGSYFIAWAKDELPHTTWLNVSAWAALVVAVLLLVSNSYTYYHREVRP